MFLSIDLSLTLGSGVHIRMKAEIVIFFLAVSAASALIKLPANIQHPVFAKNHGGARIVGGENATGPISYQVALFLGDYFCGGSLINNQWVLTAAHCGELTVTPKVVLGAWDILENETQQLVILAGEPIIHPNWTRSPPANDLALIKLPNPLNFTDVIKPIALAQEDDPDYAGVVAEASGWGLTSDLADGLSEILQKVQSPVLVNDECEQFFGDAITPKIVCLDGSEGKGGCSGDSGGPLVVSGADGEVKQIGITSFGSGWGCQLGFPTAFTRVSKFFSWISETVANN